MKLNDMFSKGYFKNLEVLKVSIVCNIFFVVCLLMSTMVLGYVSMRRQNIPYVVEVDMQTGEITNTKVLDNEYKNNSMKEKQMDYFLSKILIAVRSIPTDKTFYQKNIDSVQSFFTRESGEQLKKSLEENQVTEKLTNQVSVSVEINSIVKMEKNKNRYQIIWTEKVQNSFDEINMKKKYTAIIETGFIPVKTKKMMTENPFGFVITDLVISEMK
ncbi:MAG: type IV secretion system protein [Fusobacteriales bacterium]|nr:type IV secretion system protein [Fusobacteriales bacterium]